MTTDRDDWERLYALMQDSGGSVAMRKACLAFAHESIPADAELDYTDEDQIGFAAHNYTRDTNLCLACAYDARPHACYGQFCCCECNGADWDGISAL